MKICILSPLVFVFALFCASSAFAYDWASITVDGVATIPAGTVATVEDADIPAVEALTSIVLSANSSCISFENTRPLTIEAEISGKGSSSFDAASIRMTADSGFVTFNGGLEFSSGTYMTLGNCLLSGVIGSSAYDHLKVREGCVAEFGPNAQKRRAYIMYLQGGGTWKLSSKMPYDSSAHHNDNAQSIGKTTYVLGMDNAFNVSELTGATGWVGLISDTLDLNGYNQTLQCVKYGRSSYWTLNKNIDALVVTSKTPATLTLNGSETRGDSILFSGKANFTYSGTGRQSIFNVVSTSSGDLTVSKGAVEYGMGAAWNGNVIVGENGRFVCSGTTALTNVASAVSVAAGGVLEVSSGVTVRVGEVTFGETKLSPGLHSAAELKESFPDSFDGEGSVEVVFDGEWEWPEAGGVGYLAKGRQLVISDADVDRAELVGEYVLFAGSQMVVSNETVGLELNGKISNAGDVRIVNSCGVKIGGDISSHTGSVTIENSAVDYSATNEGAELVLRSVSSGDLTVSSGAVALRADWIGGGDIAVKDGAMLDIGSGVTATVDSLTLGGTTLYPGTYTVQQLQTKYADYVSGSGTVVVEYDEDWTWPEKGGTGILASGRRLVISDTEVSKAHDLGVLVLMGGSKLVISNETEELDLVAPITGAGDIEIWNSTGVDFRADNSERLGKFWVTNSIVKTAHRYGFGSAASPRIEAHRGKQGRFRFSGDGLTNDVAILLRTGSYFTFSEKGQMIVLNGGMTMVTCENGLNLGNTTFNGPFGRDATLGSGQFTNGKLVIQEGAEVWINGYYHTGYTFNPSGTPSTIHFGRESGADNGYYGVFRQFEGITVVCEATNALCTSGMIIPYDRGSTINLNGYNQAALTYDFENASITKDNGSRYYSFVTSAVPAVLTVKQSTGYDNKRVPCEFCGAAGLTYNGPATYNIVNRYSDTTGRLTVKQGRLVFDWNAGWGGTNVVVTGGMLALAAGAHENVLSRKADVDVSGEGKIEIGREQVRVRTLSVDGGVTLKDVGVYGGAEAGLDAAHTLECLSGAGTLKVSRNSREPQGVILIVR